MRADGGWTRRCWRRCCAVPLAGATGEHGAVWVRRSGLYVRVHAGAHASYCDSPSLAVADFLRLGLEAGRARPGGRICRSTSGRATTCCLPHCTGHLLLPTDGCRFAVALRRASHAPPGACCTICWRSRCCMEGCGGWRRAQGTRGGAAGRLFVLFSPTAVRTAGAVMPHSVRTALSGGGAAPGKLRETGRLACWWCAVAWPAWHSARWRSAGAGGYG